jgi:hypothetical protein
MLLPGLTPELLWAAGWIALLGLWVCSRDLPLRWAVPVVAIKIAIPVVYFSQDAFGSLHLTDDLDYYYRSLLLYKQGMRVETFFTHGTMFPLFLQSLGGHAGYRLWNLAAMSAFGPHYFAPVLMNVGLTFVAGWFFFRILGHLGFSPVYRRCALAFFLLHWDVLSWSSFLNLKDVLVLTLTLAVMHLYLRFFARPGIRRALPVAAALTALGLVRFYAPLLLLAAAGGHLLLTGKSRGRWRLGFFFLLGAGIFTGWKFDVVVRALAGVSPLEALYGVGRFLATPLPWNLEESYGYLAVSSFMHVLFMIPALTTAPYLWRRHRDAPLLFIYLAVVVIFYALVPMLQGPRQRLQVDFVFVWMQFHVLWALARYAAGPAPGSAARGAGAVPPAAIPQGSAPPARTL